MQRVHAEEGKLLRAAQNFMQVIMYPRYSVIGVWYYDTNGQLGMKRFVAAGIERVGEQSGSESVVMVSSQKVNE